jgi:hypothetical protein
LVRKSRYLMRIDEERVLVCEVRKEYPKR